MQSHIFNLFPVPTSASRRAVSIALVICPVLLFGMPAAHAQFGTNLIVNGDGETGVGSTDGSDAATPGWTTTGTFSEVQYGASGGFPATTDPGPTNRGLNFLAGGSSAPVSTGTETLTLGASTISAINTGKVSYNLSGWFGGFSSQNDSASLTETFLGSGGTLGSVTIGGLSAADRASVTGLFLATPGTGLVPIGTTSIQTVLTMTRTDGTYNDGYADNLSMVLTNGAGGAATAPEASSVALVSLGLPALLTLAARRRRKQG